MTSVQGPFLQHLYLHCHEQSQNPRRTEFFRLYAKHRLWSREFFNPAPSEGPHFFKNVLLYRGYPWLSASFVRHIPRACRNEWARALSFTSSMCWKIQVLETDMNWSCYYCVASVHRSLQNTEKSSTPFFHFVPARQIVGRPLILLWSDCQKKFAVMSRKLSQLKQITRIAPRMVLDQNL